MLKLLTRNISSIHRPLSTKQIEQLSPLWKQDIQKFGPWSPDKEENYIIASGVSEIDITLAGECSSALDLAHYLIEKNELKEWDSVLAVSQWKGRGRRNNNWVSPPGNLYTALLLPELPGNWKNIVSLFIGYCLNFSLNKMGHSTAIKWPNDILLDGKKIAGILVEAKKGKTVAGIGINLAAHPPYQNLSDSHAFPPGQLLEEGQAGIGPVSLWYYLVKRFKKLYYALVEAGKVDSFIPVLQQQLAFLNEQVLVVAEESAKPRPAIFTGINHNGVARFKIDGSEVSLQEAKILPQRHS
jgi:BirA family biotin operon repressor/biotin-[acetyl-CoA-carboxylase] ligase